MKLLRARNYTVRYINIYIRENCYNRQFPFCGRDVHLILLFYKSKIRTSLKHTNEHFNVLYMLLRINKTLIILYSGKQYRYHLF